MAGGRLFQTRGPATANVLSPSDVVVRGMSSIILAADREPGRPRPARRKTMCRNGHSCYGMRLGNHTQDFERHDTVTVTLSGLAKYSVTLKQLSFIFLALLFGLFSVYLLYLAQVALLCHKAAT